MRSSAYVFILAVSLPLVGWLGVAVLRESNAKQTESTQSSVWESTKHFAASEAHQAAAADEKYFYAIASEKVAKYDRATGERVAMSIGEAKHLNSGFVWAEKLYCAHSNYPRTPEQSEIRMLDPESMKLTIFKDFGNFGGSLTWAVRKGKEKGWWCNFAHYGAANDQTFLVHFDDDWKELGRWTYPPEVIRQIGTMSISGGVWREDVLFVTDHDNRRLYRMSIPRDGTVLKYLGQDTAPFTGQGIATDLVTGGLVGIDRSKKAVHFAKVQPAK